jgi:hypothetical protein
MLLVLKESLMYLDRDMGKAEDAQKFYQSNTEAQLSELMVKTPWSSN